jgi:hypothetical protein
VFVRFRQTVTRLQMSLVETRRVDCNVRHEHVASLGSIAMPTTTSDRIAFWAGLHERLAKLSNRIGPEMQHKVMGDIHARVPMVTVDEQRALQLENAKLDARQWSAVGDLVAGSDVAGRKKLIEHHEAVIAAAEPVVAIASEHVQAAEGRVAAIERGEHVAGDLTPRDFLALCKQLGITKADLRHYRFLNEAVPEERIHEFARLFVAMQRKGERRLERKAALAILRKYGGGST